MMGSPIPIYLAVEDELSKVLLSVLLKQISGDFIVVMIFERGGFGYLRKNIEKFNEAAKACPWIVLTDLDTEECAPLLIQKWLSHAPKHPHLLFRVAVREVESWLLAHREAFAKVASIRLDTAEKLIQTPTDQIPNPKEFLIQIVERYSRSRDFRADIVPRRGSSAKVGPNYNGRLSEFVLGSWHVGKAMERSDSLRRTVLALRNFATTYAPHRQTTKRRKNAQTD